MKKQTTLTTFLKDECANYDKHYEQCAFDEPCKVLAGQRCGYFEKAVLGPPDYKFRLPDYDYQKLFAQYAEQTGTKTEAVRHRRCGCGNPVMARQRFCDKCTKKRRQESTRQAVRKLRLGVSS